MALKKPKATPAAKTTSKKAKPAAAAFEINRNCTRDDYGFGALPGLGIEPDGTHERAEVSALKARLLAAGFESQEVSFVERLASMTDGDDKDALSDAWDDGKCGGWVPDAEGAGWVLAAVMFIDGKMASGEGDDVIALFARPAGIADNTSPKTLGEAEAKPWPFPKTEGGGPDASITEGVVAETTAATMSKSEAHLARKSALFELLDPTDALLKTFTPRTEKHGEDDVSAASLGLSIEAPNTILDLLSPSLRQTLYAAPEGQTTLPGVEESTPLLRTKVIETLKLTNCYEGWTLRITAGVRDDIVIGDCKVDKFVVTPRDGGSVLLDLRIGSSDIDETEAGWLYGKLRHDIEITLHAPEVKEVIDGTVGHPGAAAAAADPRDATDLFTEQHAGDEAQPASADDDDAAAHGGDELEPAEEGAES